MSRTDITAINAKTISVNSVPIAGSAAAFGPYTTFDQLDADVVLALNGTVIQGQMTSALAYTNIDHLNVLSGVSLGDVVKYGTASTVASGSATGPLNPGSAPIPTPTPTPTPTPAQIGGLAIGAEGSGFAAGYFLATGKDYADGLLELITPTNPRGRFAASRGSYLIAASGQSPKGSDGLAGYDAVPGETGWHDSNRGVPVASFADMITVSDGLLRLRQRPLQQGELGVIDKSRPVLGSMIHTAGAFLYMAPGIVEWRERRSAYARSHMTAWVINNFFSTDLIEYDIESSNKADGTGNGAQLGFNSNDWNAGVQTAVEISAAQSPSQATEHEYAFKMFPNGDVQAFMDNVSLGTATGYRAKTLARAFHALFTNHAYAAGVTSGDPVADYFLRWTRVYRHSTGNIYRPLVAGADYATPFGVPFSFILPDQATVWGTTGKTEVIKAVMVEVNEPGGANSGQVYNGFPAGTSFNPTTREFAGTISDKAGRLHIYRWIEEAGSACEPQHIILNVGPNIRLGDLILPIGITTTIELYALCDCGVLVTDGVNKAKPITVLGLSGVGGTYNDATGLMVVTPSGSYTGSITVSCTNSIGQAATKTISVSTRTAYEYESWDGDLWVDTADASSMLTSGAALRGVKNKRAGRGDLFARGSNGFTYVQNARNGLPVIRLQRNITAKAAVPRLEALDSTVPVSQAFQGNDKPYVKVDVFVSTDANTCFIWSASKATGTSTDAETVGLIRRESTPSTLRRANVTATTNDVPIRSDGTGTPRNSLRIVVTRFNGTTTDAWDTTVTGKVTTAQDAAAFTTGLIFRMGATEAPDGAGSGNFALTQGNTDFCEGLHSTTKTDAQIIQCINDLASKWTGAALS